MRSPLLVSREAHGKQRLWVVTSMVIVGPQLMVGNLTEDEKERFMQELDAVSDASAAEASEGSSD